MGGRAAAKRERLWERQETVAAIEGLLRRAERGGGGTLFIVGAAGLGKTALLDETIRRAGPLRIGRAAGESAQSALPFGFLGQALGDLGRPDPVAPAAHLAPAARRAAVLIEAQAWLDAASRTPLLLALDDCQWADPDSLGLLQLLCRRIATSPVAVVATLRPWPNAAAEVVRTVVDGRRGQIETLAPLTEVASGALMASVVGHDLPAAERSRLHRLCAGNPLLLRQLAAVLADTPTLQPTGVADQLGERLLLSRFMGLGAPALDYARAAAVYGVRFRPRAVPTAAGIDDRTAQRALDALCRARLVEGTDDTWAAFAHPLLREVLVADLPPPLRAHLHGVAFRTLWELGVPAAEAAEHAVSAGLHGDPEAIRALHQAGRQALSQGALVGAAAHLRAAAELAGDRAPVELLLNLADVLPLAGAHDEAAAVCEMVLAADGVRPAERADALRLLGGALFQAGAVVDAEASYERAALELRSTDPLGAAMVLAEAATSAVYIRGARRAVALAQRAHELARALGSSPVLSLIEVVLGHTAVLLGDASGADRLDANLEQAVLCAREPRPHMTIQWGPRLVHLQTAKTLERFDLAERAFRAGIAETGRAGNPLGAANYGVAHADTLQRQGRLAEALELLRGAREVAELMPGRAHWTAVGLAHLSVELDRPDDAMGYCAEVEQAVGDRRDLLPILQLWLLHVRAALAIGDGRAEEAARMCERAWEVADDSGIVEPCVVPWAGVAVAAFAAAGRVADLQRLVTHLDGVARPLPCRWPRGVAALGRALLREHARDREGADACFAEALAHQRAARTRLAELAVLIAHGAFLRRGGMAGRARAILAQAVHGAEACGARRLAREAHDELRAAGGRRRERAVGPGLTAQEGRVAQLARQGLTNDEIGHRLFVSGRTVEHHLAQVYAKLGVASRRDLRHVAFEVDRPAPGSEGTA